MGSFNDLKIEKKLMAAFAIIILSIAGMGLAVFVKINALEEARFDRVRASAVQRQAEIAMVHLARQESNFRAYLLSRDQFYLQAMTKEREAFNGALDRIGQLDPRSSADVTQARRAGDAWAQAAVAGTTAATAEGGALAGLSSTAGDKASIASVEGQLKALIEAKTADSRLYGERQDVIAKQARVILVVGGLLALAIAVAMAIALTQGLAKPLLVMAASMRRLAAGDTSIMVPGVSRRDELGQMASAVQTFKDAALAKEQLEREAAAQREATRLETERLEAIAAKETEDSRVAITALGEALSMLAQGNLAYRIHQQFAPKAARLKDDFNTAIAKLDEALGEVTQNVIAIRAGANEISQASDDLSNRTEQQAASLEETAAALDEITATVRRTAEGAHQAAQAVQSARGDAEASGKVVQEAVEAMSAIEQSSTKIGNIIGVIDEIAFQTNLLALNAGVEAARAGDAGRGFAVVASEVRALAQRSAEAAKEIKTLISASGRQVGSGVNLVGQTGDALQRIVARVADIDSLVSEIAASAQEQATGLQQVNSAVNQMDQVTQQNAAMVEEATAASHAMANEAEVLNASVTRFALSQVQARAEQRPVAKAPVVPAKPVAANAPASAPAPAAPKPEPVAAAAPAPAQAPAPAATPAPAPIRTPQPIAETIAALKTVGRGGAATKAQPIEDGWEEF